MSSQLAKKKLNAILLRLLSYLKKAYISNWRSPAQQREPSKIRIFLVNAGNIYSRTIQGRCPIYTTQPEGPAGSSVPIEEINLPIFHYLLPLDIWIT